jgi:hypothetical protein
LLLQWPALMLQHVLCCGAAGGRHVVWEPCNPTSSHLTNWPPGAAPATDQDTPLSPINTSSSSFVAHQFHQQEARVPSSCQPGVLWLPAQVEVGPGQLLVAQLVHNTIGWVAGRTGGGH